MNIENRQVMQLAELRRAAVEATRGADLTAYVLADVARIIEAGEALEQKDGRSWIVPTRMVVEKSDDPRVNVTSVPQLLGADGAGLTHGEFRLHERNTHYGSKPKGFKVPKESEAVAAIMQRHGVAWPPDLRSDRGSAV